MKVSVQVIVYPDDDTEAPPAVWEVLALDRDELAPDTVGLQLAEAKDLLAAVQGTELLPLGRRLHPAVVRRAVHAVADRLEGELGEERPSFIDTCQCDREELPRPDLPIVVGLDGGYVHSSQQRSRTDGWFEVIAGRPSPPPGDPPASGTCRPTTPNPDGACSRCSKRRACRPTSRSPSSPTARKTSATCRSISTSRPSICWTGST